MNGVKQNGMTMILLLFSILVLTIVIYYRHSHCCIPLFSSNCLSKICEKYLSDDFVHRFRRVFPSGLTEKYFRFMDKVRYYNSLLNPWPKKCPSADRHDAIELIKSGTVAAKNKTTVEYMEQKGRIFLSIYAWKPLFLSGCVLWAFLDFQ
jgi:hypothetical protein